jgi:hypothetical protein
VVHFYFATKQKYSNGSLVHYYSAVLISYTVTDAAGNTSTGVQNVTVVDTTAPVVIAPTAVTLEATAPLTPVTLGTGTASDLVDGAVTPTASPLGPFAVGVHTVTWTAVDANGNTGTGTQTVTVMDTTAPAITAPADLTEAATGPLTLVTLGAPTVSDLVTTVGNITITNDAPAAGFPVGSTTTVTWTVTDEANNSDSVTQTVTIESFVLGLSTEKTKLKIHHDKKGKIKDKLEVKGRYSEFANGDGLGFTSDPVTIILGGVINQTLPAGSFVQKVKDGKTEWKYKGPKSGLRDVTFDSEGKFKIKVERIDLTGVPSSSPVPLSITIGNDSGDTNATFKAKVKKGDDDKDDDEGDDEDKKEKGKKKGKK